MKNIIVKIFLIIAAISFPCKAMAQDLTEEEITFLKSLSGKWRACSDCKAPFGYSPLDFTIKYFNGYLKVSYSPGTNLLGGEKVLLPQKTLNAYFDKSTKSVNFRFEYIICSPNWTPMYDKSYEHVVIPFQTDIDDIITVISTSTMEGDVPYSEEKMLYKQ